MSLSKKILIIFLAFGCSPQPKNLKYHEFIPDHPPFWEYFTIHGIDQDNDGVRDDIEHWIVENFEDQNVRRALTLEAKLYFKLINSENTKEADSLNLELLDAQSCFLFVSGPFLKEWRKKNIRPDMLYDKINNNLWRKRHANIGLGKIPRGKAYTMKLDKYENYKACKFDIINLKELIEYYLKGDGLYKNEIIEFKKLQKRQ